MSPKVILLWTSYWHSYSNWRWLFRCTDKDSNNSEKDANNYPTFLDYTCTIQCQELQCFITANRSLLEDSAGVVWSLVSQADFDLQRESLDLPNPKPEVRRKQTWIAYWKESDAYLFSLFNRSFSMLKKLNGVFDKVMNYRKDSHFQARYVGHFKRMYDPQQIIRNKTEVWQNKKQSPIALWMVSNCKSESGRESFVHGLIKANLTVDIFGKCDPQKRPLPEKINGHSSLLIQEYKFYLSFENALCDDYATEKLSKVLVSPYTVPVVLGPSKQWCQEHLPPKSFIHVEDFDYSPARLATYLQYLSQNQTAYFEYLSWKGYYMYRQSFGSGPACKLCRYLHEKSDDVLWKPMEFVKYFTQKQCHNPWYKRNDNLYTSNN